MARTDERLTLAGLLVLALLHGWFWMQLVPPWQHYDEPAHFAYAAALAYDERDRPGRQVLAMSRVVADSMYHHRFYDAEVRPTLGGPEPTNLGVDQRVHPPLYYALAALPISLTRYLPIETQLYAARSLSLGFYVLTILTAWRIAVTVLPDEPRMQVVIPLLVLLTPTFADIMTAVNSDVLVNFAAMVGLLGAVLLIRDGFHPVGLALLLLSLIVGVLTKRTALGLLIPSLLALYWAWQRQPLSRQGWQRLFLLGIPVGLGLLVIAFRPNLSEGQISLEPRQWLASLDRQYLRLQIGLWIRSIGDWERALPLYQFTAQVSFTDLWGSLAWGHISLGSIVLGVTTLVVSATGVGLIGYRWRIHGQLPLWQQRVIWLFGITVIFAWMATLLRIHPIPAVGLPFYVPRGRYLLWSLLPHLWFVALGWQMLFPATWRRYTPLVLVMLVMTLNFAAWFVLVQFYS
ncbi:MAG: hypothetical protein AB4911_08365 [Oscillochloridaceae bacterium umkhey_bin13]